MSALQINFIYILYYNIIIYGSKNVIVFLITKFHSKIYFLVYFIFYTLEGYIFKTFNLLSLNILPFFDSLAGLNQVSIG